jgi:hypothetical protein
MQCQNAAGVMPVVHCVQVCAKAKFRHHHVNVMREIALDELGLGAAFVAGHARIYKDLFVRATSTAMSASGEDAQVENRVHQ